VLSLINISLINDLSSFFKLIDEKIFLSNDYEIGESQDTLLNEIKNLRLYVKHIKLLQFQSKKKKTFLVKNTQISNKSNKLSQINDEQINTNEIIHKEKINVELASLPERFLYKWGNIDGNNDKYKQVVDASIDNVVELLEEFDKAKEIIEAKIEGVSAYTDYYSHDTSDINSKIEDMKAINDDLLSNLISSSSYSSKSSTQPKSKVQFDIKLGEIDKSIRDRKIDIQTLEERKRSRNIQGSGYIGSYLGGTNDDIDKYKRDVNKFENEKKLYQSHKKKYEENEKIIKTITSKNIVLQKEKSKIDEILTKLNEKLNTLEKHKRALITSRSNLFNQKTDLWEAIKQYEEVVKTYKGKSKDDTAVITEANKLSNKIRVEENLSKVLAKTHEALKHHFNTIENLNDTVIEGNNVIKYVDREIQILKNKRQFDQIKGIQNWRSQDLLSLNNQMTSLTQQYPSNIFDKSKLMDNVFTSSTSYIKHDSKGNRILVTREEGELNKTVDTSDIDKWKAELESRQERLKGFEKELDEKEKIDFVCPTLNESLSKRTSFSFNKNVIGLTIMKFQAFKEKLMAFETKLIFDMESRIEVAIDIVDEKEIKDIEKRETSMQAEINSILKFVARSIRDYKHMHFDFVAKRMSSRMRYINRWRTNPEFANAVIDYKDELDDLDNTIQGIAKMVQPFGRTFAKTFQDKLFDKIIPFIKNVKSQDDVKTKIDVFSRNTFNTMDTIFLYYYDKIKLKQYLKNPQFIIMYLLKGINFVMFLFALFITESVYRQKCDLHMNGQQRLITTPPSLLIYIVLCYGIHLAFVFIFLTILVLLPLIFADSKHNFYVNADLIILYLKDYASTLVLHVSFALIYAYFVQKKRYFRYKVESKRGLTSVSEFLLLMGILSYLFPFFLFFWT
jgi:hypothetical protein